MSIYSQLKETEKFRRRSENLESELRTKDKTIDELQSTVKDVRTKNDSLNNEVKTQAKTIDEQKLMLENKDNRINELEEELKKFKDKPDGK